MLKSIEPKNKKVIFTAVSGNRDIFPTIRVKNDSYDYICFTTENIKPNKMWQVVKVEKEISNVKTARKYKILSHKYLSDYDMTVWIDANMGMENNLYEVIEREIKGHNFVCYQHSSGQFGHNYEINRCISMRKDDEKVLLRQRKAYQEITERVMLPATGIILRKKTERVKEFEKLWWEHVKEYSCRDQIAFCYAVWKLNFEWSPIKTARHKWFCIGPHKRVR